MITRDAITSQKDAGFSPRPDEEESLALSGMSHPPSNPKWTGRDSFREGLAQTVKFLNDSLLGFLALLAAELALAPMFIDLPPLTARLLDSAQWVIIGAFGVEYLSSFLLADDRKRFVLDPWRMLDLFIIIVPVISLVPSVSNALRSAPVLRLLRLLRLASFAARVSGSVVREEGNWDKAIPTGPPEIKLFKAQGELRPRQANWDDFVAWVAKPEGGWCHLSNITSAQFDTISRIEGLPRSLLESCLSSANYPRLEMSRRNVVLSVWLPSPAASSEIEPEKSAVLLVAGPSILLTLAPQASELPAMLLENVAADTLASAPFPARLALALLKLVLDRNESVAGHLEQHLRGLEEVPVRDSKPAFFEQSFRLRKELSAAKSDLWRIKGILSALAEGRVRLGEKDQPDQAEVVRILSDRADYLYQTVDNLREGLLSVLELHLNVVSFEMNKFMRLLAVVSVLGLIPAVVGGLLGMNVAGNPWPATLGQITYGVCAAVLLVLYLFLIRGWLR